MVTMTAATKPKTTIDTVTVTHRILRPFEAGGIVLGHGELVDATNWRSAQSLVSLRYMAPADPASDPLSCECGRLWADVEAMTGHIPVCAVISPDDQINPDQTIDNEEPDNS